MTRLSHYAALAVFTAVIASSSAYARTNHNSAAPLAGAHNSTVDEMEIRKQCYAQAKERWPGTNQDMNTTRDFTYRTCAFDRGVRNP